jgi:hypothetical protein
MPPLAISAILQPLHVEHHNPALAPSPPERSGTVLTAQFCRFNDSSDGLVDVTTGEVVPGGMV